MLLYMKFVFQGDVGMIMIMCPCIQITKTYDRLGFCIITFTASILFSAGAAFPQYGSRGISLDRQGPFHGAPPERSFSGKAV